MKAIKILIAIAIMVLGAFLIRMAWKASGSSEDELRQQQQYEVNATVFLEEMLPLEMSKYLERNADAIERLRQRLDDQFAAYRARIPAFIDDATDYGSKAKIIWKSSSDWIQNWRNAETQAVALETYMAGKFEHHFFTTERLDASIQKNAEQFAEDIAANRKVLYASLEKHWEKYPFGDKPFDADELLERSEETLRVVMAQRGTELGMLSAGSLVGSELLASAAGHLTHMLYTWIVAQTASSSSTAAATAAGSTAAGAGTGAAGGGATGGPAGALIGAGVGLVIGVAVDWYMTDRMRDKLAATLENYFGEIQHTLIHGGDGQPGIVKFYSDILSELSEREQGSILQEVEAAQ